MDCPHTSDSCCSENMWNLDSEVNSVTSTMSDIFHDQELVLTSSATNTSSCFEPLSDEQHRIFAAFYVIAGNTMTLTGTVHLHVPVHRKVSTTARTF